jgi:L-glutamine-phosphate cytidylyltransferase
MARRPVEARFVFFVWPEFSAIGGGMIEKAIILSAGQGSRLLPLTADRPKCLIDFSGRSLLAWQIAMLTGGGVREVEVVTGFMAELVEQELARQARPGLKLTTRFNPFYKVADNLASCWMAREAMTGDFLLLNGDTLISHEIVAAVQRPHQWPIAVTVDVKPAYDSDDMKVTRQGERLLAIGKTLTAEQSNAESIGFLAFRGQGGALFRDRIEAFMRTPAGIENWYLKVIDALAPDGQVGTVAITGSEWGEVDFLNDVDQVERMTRRWRDRAEGGLSAD